MPRRSWSRKLTLALAFHAAPVVALPAGPEADTPVSTQSPAGRPEVHLDRLDFPEDVQGSAVFKAHLRRVLKREVRRVEWGAGRQNRIEYRFKVSRLSIEAHEGVLKVSCAATGMLPGGKTAHSQLTFGGAPERRTEVVKQVLEIVARGVIARLAELERRRRGLS